MARWRRPVLIPGAAAHDLALVVDAGGDRLVGDPHAERAGRAPVGVRAFDAAALAGAPRIAEADRLVLADDAGRLAVLFGEPERAAPTKATRRLALMAIGVPDVADVYVHEALWTAWDILS